MNENASEKTSESHPCEHCGATFESTYAWEVHTLSGCADVPKDHKEWINGGPLNA